MAAWASRGPSTATCSIAVPTRWRCHWAARRIGKPNSSTACAGATRPEGQKTMNFDDTPEEAKFRSVARAWIAANAPKELRAPLERSGFATLNLEGKAEPMQAQ